MSHLDQRCVFIICCYLLQNVFALLFILSWIETSLEGDESFHSTARWNYRQFYSLTPLEGTFEFKILKRHNFLFQEDTGYTENNSKYIEVAETPFTLQRFNTLYSRRYIYWVITVFCRSCQSLHTKLVF